MVKRYVLEKGSNVVSEVYERALEGDLTLSFSAWNVGEVLGVLDRYRRRGWLSARDYHTARNAFVLETLRLLKLGLVKVVPVKTGLLIKTWGLIEKYHIYEADALQLISAIHVGSKQLLTGDRRLAEVAREEGLKAVYLEA